MKMLDVFGGDNIKDFDQLKESGMPICTKVSEGCNWYDDHYDYRYKECKKRGIPISFYHMLTKNPDVEGQAIDFWNEVKNYDNDMLNMLDVEYENIPNAEEYVNRFLAKYKELSGQDMLVYSYRSYFQERFSQSFLNSHWLWVADYCSRQPNFSNLVVWQYSESCKDYWWVGNSDGCVDINKVLMENVLFRHGPSIPAVNTTTQSHPIDGNNIISIGQQHANNFAGCGLCTDGIRGELTRKGAIKVLQHAMNLDYNVGLEEDGKFGKYSRNALSGHTVRQGETQYMVTALEILLMLKGYNPNGVECPGTFGNGLSAAVGKYQSDNGLDVDNIAGFNTFESLIS